MAGRRLGEMLAVAFLLVALVPNVSAGITPEGSTTPVHDPTIVSENGVWYAFSTGSLLPIRRSTDLVHWNDAGVAFPGGLPAWLASTIPTDDSVWAPDVSFFHGEWHLYYAKGVFGSPDAAIGLATNTTLDPDDPAYAWVDHGQVIRSLSTDSVAAIDPNLVIDQEGNPWLAWGSFWDGLFIQRVDPESGMLLDGAPRINLARRDPWWLGVEGVDIVYRDGWWWLYASFGYCCQGVNSFYSVHVGRSRKLTGPYVDMAGVPMLHNGGTLLIGSHDNEIGIGHGTVFDSGANGWQLIHHYYDADNGGVPTMGLTPILELDGWPIGVNDNFVVATDPSVFAPGTWHLWGYAENRPSYEPDDVTLGLRRDGTVAGGGTWRAVGQVLEVSDVMVTQRDGAKVMRSWRLLVDKGGDKATGRDERTAVVRATRTGPTPAPKPGVPSNQHEALAAEMPPAPAASPVVAVPTFTG